MHFGIDRLLEEPALRKPLAGRRVALLAHPASVTRDLVHSLDALAALGDLKLTAAFGPQHGLRGDKQDNMVESPDFIDPVHGIPVFSLYGEVRRPTAAMMDSFDVLLVDLQDVGCRIYTFITTLRYVLEAAARARQGGLGARSTQPGRPPGRGPAAARRLGELRRRRPAADAPRPHARRAGALVRAHAARSTSSARSSRWTAGSRRAAPGYGWPLGERTWVNPSPNAANLSMARCYAGTVHARRHDAVRRSRHDAAAGAASARPTSTPRALLAKMDALAPHWLHGCRLRPCWFEPTFHKHAGKLCARACRSTSTIPAYDHDAFRPWRLVALAFKALRRAAAGLRRCGATSPTSTSTTACAIDLHQRQRRCCGSGSTIPPPHPPISTRSPPPDEASWRDEREAVLLYR